MVDKSDAPQGEQHRADSLGASMGGASLASALSALGTTAAKGSSLRINWGRRAMTESESRWMYRFNGYARSIVRRPVRSAFRAGWTVVDDTDNADAMSQFDRTMQVRRKLSQAMTWARTQGRAGVWMVVRDGLDPSEPLDLARIRSLRNLIALERNDITPISYVSDEHDPRYGEPWMYQVTLSSGESRRVHGSRVLLFRGAETMPRDYRTNGGADDSVLDACWDKLSMLEAIDLAGATVVQEGSYSVLTIPGLANVTTAEQAQSMLAQVRRILRGKSLVNGFLLGEGETVDQRSISITGYKDIADRAIQGLAAVSGQPLPMLMGIAPGGLNADGDSWQRAWADYVEGDVMDGGLRDKLEVLYEVAYHAGDGPTRGVVPGSWHIEFGAVAPETAMELAKRRQIQMQTAAIAVQSGILDAATATASFYGPDGWQDEMIPMEPVDGPTDAEIAEALARYDAADRLTIPKAAREAARKVLRWREEHGAEVQAMTETGWRRARQLATSETITLDTARTMRAWFARHAESAGLADEHKGEPWRDNGYVAWLGWGGDVMRRAVDEFVAAREDG